MRVQHHRPGTAALAEAVSVGGVVLPDRQRPTPPSKADAASQTDIQVPAGGGGRRQGGSPVNKVLRAAVGWIKIRDAIGPCKPCLAPLPAISALHTNITKQARMLMR